MRGVCPGGGLIGSGGAWSLRSIGACGLALRPGWWVWPGTLRRCWGVLASDCAFDVPWAVRSSLVPRNINASPLPCDRDDTPPLTAWSPRLPSRFAAPAIIRNKSSLILSVLCGHPALADAAAGSSTGRPTRSPTFTRHSCSRPKRPLSALARSGTGTQVVHCGQLFSY